MLPQSLRPPHYFSSLPVTCLEIEKVCRLFLLLKGCGSVLKEAPPAAARETLPIVAAKLENTEQCGRVSVLPITGLQKMSKSGLIKWAAHYLFIFIYLKVVSPAAARETLPIVAIKLESTAQCGTFPVPPPPNRSCG